MSVNQLKKELEISCSAIRQHLASLEGKGMIDHTVQRQGIGRPTLLYKLTDRAEGFFFKATDKRCEERIKKEIFVVLDYQGHHLEAESTDFSKGGVGIKILGETPFAIGESVKLSTVYIQIKAKVIWMNKIIGQSLVGLQRLI